MPTKWIDKTNKRVPRGSVMGGIGEDFTRDIALAQDRVGLPSRTATDATSRIARRLRKGRERGEARRKEERKQDYYP